MASAWMGGSGTTEAAHQGLVAISGERAARLAMPAGPCYTLRMDSIGTVTPLRALTVGTWLINHAN
jgi:hypothetical protein